MARAGDGTFSLAAGNPVAFGLKPFASSLWNNTQSDIATALSDSLSRSGKGGMLAALAMGGFAITGLATPSNATDASTKGYVDTALTTLNASNLNSGTVPDARFPATLPALSGVNLSALNASNLGSGTVPSARVSGAYSGITGLGTLTGNLTLNGDVFADDTSTGSGGLQIRMSAGSFIIRPNTSTGGWAKGLEYRKQTDNSLLFGIGVLGSNESAAGTFAVGPGSSWWSPGMLTIDLATGKVSVQAPLSAVTAFAVTGASGTNDVADFFGGTTNSFLSLYSLSTGQAYLRFGNATNGERVRMWGDNSRNWVLSTNSGTNADMQVASTGAVSVDANRLGTQIEVGFRGVPQNIQNANYTTVMADAAKHIYHTSASAHTYTIDSNANVAYPIGTTLTFVNENAGGNVTIAITSDTMRLSPGGATGSRTLTANGRATALKVSATLWQISGSNLS